MPRRSAALIAAAAVLAAPALLLGGIYLGGHPELLPPGIGDALVREDIRTFDTALDTVQDDFLRRTDRDELLDAAIAGMLESLDDRFSAYFDPREYAEFQEASSGAFSGVGMEVTEDPRGLRVIRSYEGTPARRAGLRKDDLIVAVDGRSIAGRPSQVSTAHIRGRPGTRVTLTLVRGDRRRDIRLTRARVNVPVVEARTVEAGGVRIGIAELAGFTNGSHGELRTAIDGLLERGARGLVLDLRGNGGGLLDEAVLVASIFLPDGTVVVTDGRTRPREAYRATGAAISPRIPVVVLVDGDSASASEIVAGALADRDRGVVVGTRTFGKGVFQEVVGLPNGGGLDLTVGEYFTPSGRNLGGGGSRRGAGVRPQIAARDDPDTERDEALAIAVRTLLSGSR